MHGGRRYKVRWHGKGKAEDTWLPETRIDPGKIASYKKSRAIRRRVKNRDATEGK